MLLIWGADLLGQLDQLCHALGRPNGRGMVGTVLAEERETSELLASFREHLVAPRRQAIRAIQSIVLTAWAAGVASNWVGWIGFGGIDDARPLLGIPDTYDALAILPFGYLAAAVGAGKKNCKPQDEVVSHGRFGQPLERG